jgi:hypothetical protein
MKPKAVNSSVKHSLSLSRDIRVMVTLVARPLLTRCARDSMMYSRAERVVIFEQYFASKSFATAPETF